MVVLIDRTIAGRRARAAMEYAGLNWKDLADRSGLSPDVVRRIISPTSPRGFKNREEWEAIAGACGVPGWFLERGFEKADRAGQVDAPVADQVRELRAAVAALSGDILRHARELQELRDRDRRQERPAGGDQG